MVGNRIEYLTSTVIKLITNGICDSYPQAYRIAVTAYEETKKGDICFEMDPVYYSNYSVTKATENEFI